MTDYRREEAKRIRDSASQMAYDRPHPDQQNNGDEQRYASANYAMSFTKGLEHDETTGLVKNPRDFEAFRTAIDNGFVEPFTSRVPVPRETTIINGEQKEGLRRKWEAPTAGIVYDLQGPDPESITMPPAPELCSDELTFEMAEVYELALLRDVPFHAFVRGGRSTNLTEAIDRLNNLQYAKDGFKGRPRKTGTDDQLDKQTVFRGSSPGVDKGPYLSQFLIIGNASPDEKNTPDEGYINFGAQRIDQRVLMAENCDDYMMAWKDWLKVQQGFDVGTPGQKFTDNRRFIYTPRDLATYVHIDALYQAYLNACLILLSNNTPFDPAFDLLSGGRDDDDMVWNPKDGDKVPRSAGGFALWGGPHILSLVTEVATRALKAVRYQKFNNHLRLRPEALAARLEKATEIEEQNPTIYGCFSHMVDDLNGVLKKIKTYNKKHPTRGAETVLLPMAFAEGSPMHPSYGAGHATVAGACTTMLKAFFDTSAIFAKINHIAGFYTKDEILKQLKCYDSVEVGSYQVKGNGKELDFDKCGSFMKDGKEEIAKFVPDSGKVSGPLTLEGELNKLAANISIGRNMAGVHYFSDYYDSLRMGEEIAIGILEEQALCYKTDPFVLSLPTFDGQVRRIGKR